MCEAFHELISLPTRPMGHVSGSVERGEAAQNTRLPDGAAGCLAQGLLIRGACRCDVVVLSGR